MRCIAIDDEPLALIQLEGYIRRTPFLELAGSCSNALHAVSRIEELRPDLVLVDIQMPDMNGLDLVRSLSFRPMLIFTTAYSEYALEGFRADALDYLLKPFSHAEFMHAAEKAFRQFRLMKLEKQNRNNGPGQIIVKSEYKLIQLNLAAITHVESRSEYLRIYSENLHPIMTLGSMKSILNRLPGDAFMRVHRSYIINLDKITSVGRNQVILNNQFRIPVGDQYKKAFKSYLNLRLHK